MSFCVRKEPYCETVFFSTVVDARLAVRTAREDYRDALAATVFDERRERRALSKGMDENKGGWMREKHRRD